MAIENCLNEFYLRSSTILEFSIAAYPMCDYAACHPGQHCLQMCYLFDAQLKGVRVLRGYFGPLLGQKLKIAFHQFPFIGLLED